MTQPGTLTHLNPEPNSQPAIDAYLRSLHRHLRDLLDEDARDIVEEIRTHLLDTTSADASPETVAATLAALGTPEELASRYRTSELLDRARQARSTRILLRNLLRWTGLSLLGLAVLAVSAVGYLFGGFWFCLGVLKIINPHHTGFWAHADPHSTSFNFGSGGATSDHDLFGWGLIPIGVLGGGAVILLTFRFGLWATRRFWRPRAWQQV